ncbi:amino acid adenylation domain-containing protein [Streptomyces ipomoeae]|jgi:amino acid adenylation domain-containing protein|uniref:Amino acid adenylation domain-containing protein n=1 Tax=Streptomyces ipomoeae TaxID=103232 RepID=A0AAE8VZ46_9ACTN|nr:amino acid adenylation domain-containing protein [Streptomyces ipomoeae]TQE22727.1 amino acid adenylation domain-containing protein [Streptomyces ipomoeae]TQE27939.1 amino acid adenylation domain-containing protein [Streptomyces ipomoeae]
MTATAKRENRAMRAENRAMQKDGRMPTDSRDAVFTRPVTPSERIQFLASPAEIPAVLQVLLEGHGRIDAAELRHAVAVTAEACPGTRLALSGANWTDTGRAPEVRVLDRWCLDREELADEPALHTPLTGEGEPTCEVLLVDGPDSTVVFRANHGVMDGGGMRHWITSVFAALRGEPPVEAKSSVTDLEFVNLLHAASLPTTAGEKTEAVEGSAAKADGPATGTGAPGEDQAPLTDVELFFQLLASVSADAAEDAPATWPPVLAHPQQPGSRRLFWRRRTIDGNHLGLVAKLATAITRASGLDRARFGIPVDLRRHAPELRTTGNLTMGISVDIQAGDDWTTAHHSVLTALADRRELPPGPVPTQVVPVPLEDIRQSLVAMDAQAALAGEYFGSAALSSLGRVALADVSTEAFEATTVYSLPMILAMSPPMFTIMECDGRAEIVLGWHDGPDAVARGERLLDDVVEELVPLARRGPHARGLGQEATEPAPAPAPTTLTALFREQVSRTPDAIALDGPEGPVTYGDLDRRANAVARALRARGIGKGDVIGLLADRGTAFVAGMWGVLKAGAAFLPLEPDHPDSHVLGLLADAGSPLCLVQDRHRTRLGDWPSFEVLVLERVGAAEADPGSGPDSDPVPDLVEAEDLAYVLYTSGSTGRPKGVEVGHRSVVNYVRWAVRLYGMNAATRIPLFASVAFDWTYNSVFPPLLSGGTVLLVPEEPNHVVLRALLEESGANTLSLTPTHLDLIGRLGLSPRGFKVVAAAGEPLTRLLAERTQRIFGPDCRIVNAYGPTEATIACTAGEFDAERHSGAPTVPIGLPADHSAVYLIADDRQFTKPGEIGEICVSGAALALGYRQRPDLTRERFVRLGDGTRVYRTGDLGRLLPDGTLECLGRIDHQVKVNGVRVEPAEIARCLEEHPAVERAVVTAQVRPGDGRKVLCAHVVLGTPVEPDLLAVHAAARLPHYMVPTVLMPVAELPRTTSDKIDVKALPAPFAQKPCAPAHAAQTVVGDEIEEAVARVWGRVLAVDPLRLGTDADFHLLGGDSASLIAMLGGVSTELVGADLEKRFLDHLPRILAQPTLAQVCSAVREVREADTVAARPAGEPAPAGSTQPNPFQHPDS